MAHVAAHVNDSRITDKPEVEPMVRGSSLQKLENQNLDEGNCSPSALNLRKVIEELH